MQMRRGREGSCWMLRFSLLLNLASTSHLFRRDQVNRLILFILILFLTFSSLQRPLSHLIVWLSLIAQINFNSHYKMIKTFVRGITHFVKRYSYALPRPQCLGLQTHRPRFHFCGKNILETPLAIHEGQEMHTQTAKVGEEEVELVKTQGSISIIDRVPGVKAENGEMYVLSFTCTKCETKSIRSFTKHAYHKGVVLVRCGGCENIHLVADNIGWFDDKPSNVETMHEGKVKRVHDPFLISQFLHAAFQSEQSPKGSSPK